MHLERGSLDSLLQEAIQEVGQAAVARNIEFRYQGEGEGHAVSMQFDRIKLRQAVLNLLTNAIEASPETGLITIWTQPLEDQVQIVICDEGAGIQDELREQIFTPFFSTKKTGSGLGLAFTEKIVELHHGTVSAQNNPDLGATFTITLPLTAKA